MNCFKIYFIGFLWNPGFKNTNIITRVLNAEDKIVDNIDECNTIIIGDSLTLDEYNILSQLDKRDKIIIQYVAEPITKLLIIELLYAKHLFENEACHMRIGCVKNDLSTGYIKYPLYAYDDSLLMQNKFDEINDYVLNSDPCNKDFCVLINRHDYGNTRTIIYEELSKYGKITCPGALFNNISNEECDRVGVPEYIKNYKFNICCENFGAAHEGYITEKLMNACMGGAIPIYYGELDEMDEKIFNKERIIFVTNETAVEVAAFVDELNKDEVKLRKFYEQPVFKDTAAETIRRMFTNMYLMFNYMRHQLCCDK